MTQRKTIQVERVRELVNNFLKLSDDSQSAERLSHASLVEVILHETGNYKGFKYLNVVYDDGAPPFIPDETRRFYF